MVLCVLLRAPSKHIKLQREKSVCSRLTKNRQVLSVKRYKRAEIKMTQNRGTLGGAEYVGAAYVRYVHHILGVAAVKPVASTRGGLRGAGRLSFE